MDATQELTSAWGGGEEKGKKAATPSPAPAPAPAPAAASEGEGEHEEGQPGEGEEEGQPGADEDGEEFEEGEGEGEGEEEPVDPARLVTVVIDGKKEKVPLSELIANAQKDRAASKRLEEASILRRQYEEKARAVEPERQAIGQKMTQLDQALRFYNGVLTEQLHGLEPDPALINTDFQLYTRQKAAYEARQRDLVNIRSAQAQLEKDQAALTEKARGDFLDAERGKVLDAIPEWRDAKKASAELTAICDMLGEYGFNQEEIGAIIDSRQVRFLHKAMTNAQKAAKYDELVSKGALAQKRVTNTPPIAERSGARQQSNGKEVERKKAESAFNKNPSRKNLEAFFR